MRRWLIVLGLGGLLLIFVAGELLGNPPPVQAQTRVTPVRPPPGGGPAPDRPPLEFTQSTPFRIPAAQIATPTATSLPEPTATPLPPTRTPTSVPTPTTTPFPSLIALNEILSNARNVDWNLDGATGTDDQWIEIYNGGVRSADLSGWIIDTGERTITFTIPAGTNVASNGWITFYRKQTGLALDNAAQVRLLYPNGNVANLVDYPALGDDQVYARSKDGEGAWRLGCSPSPNASNCTLLATATSGFGMGFFREHIASPSGILDINVVATNVLLAIILALTMGFFGNLLNDAFESNEEQVARMFAPLVGLLDAIRKAGSRFDAWMAQTHLAGLAFFLKLAVILLLYGLILAYLDPSFTLITQDGIMLILALALSTGLMSIIDDLASYIFLRSRSANAAVRLHSGNFILVVFSTLFSRLSGLVPGILLGSPAGIADVDDDSVSTHLSFIAVGVTALVAVLAWLIAPSFESDAWLNTLFLLIFAAGIQTAFFEMIPLKYLQGRSIFQYNRFVWVGLFAILATFFLQTMLNPDGAFVSAFNSPNMIILTIVVTAFCVFSVLVWFYFQRLEKAQAV